MLRRIVNINIKNIFKGKTILLAILMIIAISLFSNNTSTIMPFMLFIGIFVGLMKKNEIKEAVLASFISSFIGSLVTFIISLIIVYYTYGSLYTIFILQYSWIYLIFYIIVGTVGGALGYYIAEEIGSVDM